MKKAQKVKVLAAVPVRNETAYDGCFPKQKQFYFADKHPPNKIYNHVVDSCLRTSVLVSFSDWLVLVQLFCYQIVG